jgi:hypothetical protein
MAAEEEGVTMRNIRTYALVTALVALAVIVALVATGCGTAAQSAASAQAGPATAGEILTQALASSGSITSGTGDFNVSVAVNGDASKMPAGAQALLGQPITFSGTMTFAEDPTAAEATANISLAGQNIPLGLKVVDQKAWVQFMGQWYEAPADMMGTATTGTTAAMPDAATILQTLATAGVDPTTWLANLTVVGEDTIDGTPTYHLSGTLDLNKVITDVTKLMQDKTIQGLLPSIGAGAMGTDTSITMPSPEELQSLQSELGSMFQNLTVDMWIAKDTYQLRQAQIEASIVPPAGQDAQGITGINIKATASIAPATSPVTVNPPTDAKPFSELQQSLGALEGLLSGALGGGATGSGTTGQ